MTTAMMARSEPGNVFRRFMAFTIPITERAKTTGPNEAARSAGTARNAWIIPGWSTLGRCEFIHAVLWAGANASPHFQRQNKDHVTELIEAARRNIAPSLRRLARVWSGVKRPRSRMVRTPTTGMNTQASYRHRAAALKASAEM